MSVECAQNNKTGGGWQMAITPPPGSFSADSVILLTVQPVEKLQPPGKRPSWLRVERVLGERGIPRDSAAGRRQSGRLMELRKAEGDDEAWKKLRRGWNPGGKEFRKELP